MYEQSKSFQNFYVAGFKYWDGPFVLGKLKAGKKLTLKPEFDNPADPNAIALYYKGTKIGYVPRNQNSVIAQLLYFGHRDVFEAYGMAVDPDKEPWEQVYVGIRVKDARHE